ncbi:MAG: alanine--glyoxylate aminotransferase family protein [archaeon GB-1867-035]|nr:alanine--glyoxylate aminotransferase family protein [Candidatus Culexmicrobium profundum]
MKKPLLMIPGPTEVSERVLKVLSKPIVPHYGEKWKPLYDEIIKLLKKLFKTEGDIFIIPGAGSLAIEISAINVIDKEMKVLIPSNGYFGERLFDIFSPHGEVEIIRFEWGEDLNINKIREKVEEDPKIKAIAVVHVETSTGVVNPIEKISQIAYDNDLIFIVDGISSIGGIPFKMDEWHVDIAFVGPQKCLGAIAGITPMAVSQKFWEYMKKRGTMVPSWYLSLETWKNYVKEEPWHPYPSTLPSPLILALREALIEIFEEGLERRFERHRKTAKIIREGLSRLGFKVVAREDNAAATVTVAATPNNVNPSTLIKKIEENHGILISRGLGKFENKWIRIGHMANTAKPQYAMNIIKAIEVELSKLK